MKLPVHTPYDGSHPLFKIGLAPLSKENWIQIDEQFEHQLTEKKRLLKERYDDVFVAEADTIESQQEVLDLLVQHLTNQFPEIYSKSGDKITVKKTDCRIDLGDKTSPPLVRISRLIQEDLVIMRRSEDGWRLVAACVCFPSSWNLPEKFGKALQDVHGPVPGFDRDSRNASVINRIFDNLQINQPVHRINWSTYGDNELFHNSAHSEHRRAVGGHINVDELFLRVEYQTLTKLERSGDVLFTIRIYIDPISVIRSLPNAEEDCEGFSRLLLMLNPDQMEYKGLEILRDRIVEYCRAKAGNSGVDV